MKHKKLLIGRTIRKIRNDAELTQAAFAERLGISTSYLNQIENNQRHLSASVLLSLAENFSIDIASFSEQDSDRLIADIAEVFSDPLISSTRPSTTDIKLVAQGAPDFARAFIAMHHNLRRASEQLAELDETIERSDGLSEPTPYEEVRDFFHYLDNYVDELDQKAENLHKHISKQNRSKVRALADYIEQTHRVRVIIGTENPQNTNNKDNTQREEVALRRFDPVAHVLYLNRRSLASTQAFQIAHQIAQLEFATTIETFINEANFHSEEAAAICRIGMANYFAGATILPYGDFSQAAKEMRYDLVLLADNFEASIEQVAHRLSTLQRPGAKGIPFFFARVDQAGNITKRHSATKLQFARFGSACPLWNVHQAFETPNRIIRQLAETTDGAQYLCLATTVSKPSGGFHAPVQRYALALGCEITHAEDLIYGDDLDTNNNKAFEKIGVSCRICERRNCHQRALPPLKRGLKIDENNRKTIPYEFE